MRISKGVNGDMRINIPKRIAKLKGWKVGDDLGFAVIDEKIIEAKYGDVVLKVMHHER